MSGNGYFVIVTVTKITVTVTGALKKGNSYIATVTKEKKSVPVTSYVLLTANNILLLLLRYCNGTKLARY